MTMLQESEQADWGRHQMANLLSLDQSSHTTGYAIFKNGVPIVVSHFDTKKTDDLPQRLHQIRNKIIELVHTYEIDELVFEDIQLQDIKGNKEAGYKTFKTLAEVLGVVHEVAVELKIPYTAIQPIVWKATFKIAGKGRAKEKQMAQEYILNNYNITCTEDEADAFCIGIHHLSNKTMYLDWSD